MSDQDNDMKAELERLRAENNALKKTSAKGLSLKVSEKGALSVYGLGRFPVTLYKEQRHPRLHQSERLQPENQAIKGRGHLLVQICVIRVGGV